jgi:hypothetical protein
MVQDINIRRRINDMYSKVLCLINEALKIRTYCMYTSMLCMI